MSDSLRPVAPAPPRIIRLPEPVPIRTSEELRFWRTERKLSQRDLMRLVGVDNHTVSRWETGERKVPAWLELCLNYLDLREDWVHPQRIVQRRSYVPVNERAS
jgi:transcriptional regulator with XRE-family HTH domain